MQKRLRKLVLALVLALSLTSIAGQIVSAGTAIRCGSACHTASRNAPPPTADQGPPPNPGQ